MINNITLEDVKNYTPAKYIFNYESEENKELRLLGVMSRFYLRHKGRHPEAEDIESFNYALELVKEDLEHYTDVDDIPILYIEDVGYLSWFRGYRLQISGSATGDGDNGSSASDLQQSIAAIREFPEELQTTMATLYYKRHLEEAFNRRYKETLEELLQMPEFSDFMTETMHYEDDLPESVKFDLNSLSILNSYDCGPVVYTEPLVESHYNDDAPEGEKFTYTPIKDIHFCMYGVTDGELKVPFIPGQKYTIQQAMSIFMNRLSEVENSLKFHYKLFRDDYAYHHSNNQLFVNCQPHDLAIEPGCIYSQVLKVCKPTKGGFSTEDGYIALCVYDDNIQVFDMITGEDGKYVVDTSRALIYKINPKVEENLEDVLSRFIASMFLYDYKGYRTVKIKKSISEAISQINWGAVRKDTPIGKRLQTLLAFKQSPEAKPEWFIPFAPSGVYYSNMLSRFKEIPKSALTGKTKLFG